MLNRGAFRAQIPVGKITNWMGERNTIGYDLYVMSGETPTGLKHCYLLNFSTKTASKLVDILSKVAVGAGGANSKYKAYCMGGVNNTDSYLSMIQGILFSTRVYTAISAVLAVARRTAASVNSELIGIVAGGYSGSRQREIDGIQFSDETAINPSAILAEVERTDLSGHNSNLTGFFNGGGSNTAANTSAIDSLVFATLLSENTSASLVTARTSMSSFNSKLNGFNCGGYTTAPVSEIDGLNYATETTINPSSNLSYVTANGAGGNSLEDGYVCFGSTGSIYMNSFQKFSFSDSTISVVEATIDSRIAGACTAQSGGIL